MYVVTADHAMTEAARATSVLLPIKSLDDVLAALAATETPDIRDTVENFLSKADVRQAIQGAIKANIEDLYRSMMAMTSPMQKSLNLSWLAKSKSLISRSWLLLMTT